MSGALLGRTIAKIVGQTATKTASRAASRTAARAAASRAAARAATRSASRSSSSTVRRQASSRSTAASQAAARTRAAQQQAKANAASVARSKAAAQAQAKSAAKAKIAKQKVQASQMTAPAKANARARTQQLKLQTRARAQSARQSRVLSKQKLKQQALQSKATAKLRLAQTKAATAKAKAGVIADGAKASGPWSLKSLALKGGGLIASVAAFTGIGLVLDNMMRNETEDVQDPVQEAAWESLATMDPDQWSDSDWAALEEAGYGPATTAWGDGVTDGDYVYTQPDDIDTGVGWVDDSLDQGGMLVTDENGDPYAVMDADGDLTGLTEEEVATIQSRLGLNPILWSALIITAVGGVAYAVKRRGHLKSDIKKAAKPVTSMAQKAGQSAMSLGQKQVRFI